MTAALSPEQSLPTHCCRTTTDRADIQHRGDQAPPGRRIRGAAPITRLGIRAASPQRGRTAGCRLVALVALGLTGVVLDDYVARAQLLRGAIIELEVNFAVATVAQPGKEIANRAASLPRD